VVRSTGTSGRLEFLALRRAAISRFAPGFVVFPGGVVEPGDSELARRWFGDADQTGRVCALRELAEETGLVATRKGVLKAPGNLPGDPDFPPPHASSVPQVARWIAPVFLPVRFDARFFALVADDDVQPVADGVEIESAWWAQPTTCWTASEPVTCS
jgi:ribonuclease/clavin/mitogillin